MSTFDRIIEGQMLDESAWLEIGEFCAYLRVERHWVTELVEAGVIEPRGTAPDAWSFPASAIVRARATARLVNDLGVNLAGAAVILDLIEERDRLERRLAEIERLLDR
ncbi:MAG: chaperone modulator CbpM [Steroidobacteraceae bacterium]